MIYTGKCKVKSDRLEAFLLVAKELKVSSVEDWKVDEHGVEPIEEEVEDGECIEQEEEETYNYKRRKTTRKKMVKKRRIKNKLTATETFNNIQMIQTNCQENVQIVKQRHIGRKRKVLKPNWLSFESRLRSGDLLTERANELSKGKLQQKKKNPRTDKKREITLTETGNEVVIPKSAFDCQAKADSRSGGELKCKFCENLFVSKGALSYHMTSEQCL